MSVRCLDGEDAVAYRHYKRVNRVVVRREALERDFDAQYDHVVCCLGENAGVVEEDEDLVHFRRDF